MSSNSLLALAKKVIRKAGEIGLEEAGHYLCGPAWPYVKKVLSPVIEELEKKFPKLLLVPEEASKAAEALSKDVALQDMLQSGFAELESGQEEILAALARQNETLIGIGEAINSGFLEADEKLDDAFKAICSELRALKFKIADFHVAPKDEVALELSIDEINKQATSLQWDAVKWVVAGDAKTASERLSEARVKLEAGLKRAAGHAGLLVCFGFVQKTQAQVSQLQGNHQEYVNSLAEAAKYFAEVLRNDPTNLGALNGMANIYSFDKDYDRAIQLGTLAVHSNPNYGAAAWDLAIALENKMKVIGKTPKLVEQLKSVYCHLQALMPQQPQAFTASELAYVQKRLVALESLQQVEESVRQGFVEQEKRQETVIKRVDELESLLKFSGQPLPDEKKERITSEVRAFLAYMRGCGAEFGDVPEVDIVTETQFGQSIHYELQRNAMVISVGMVDATDLIFRECCFRVFHGPLSDEVKKEGITKVEDSGEGFELGSILSALGFYFACSFKNDAEFGDTRHYPPMDLVNPDLSPWRFGLGLADKRDKDENERVYYVTAVGEYWARWFWSIRELIGGERCDRLLVQTWNAVVAESPATGARQYFYDRILKKIKRLNEQSVDIAQQSAKSLGLNMQG